MSQRWMNRSFGLVILDIVVLLACQPPTTLSPTNDGVISEMVDGDTSATDGDVA